MNVYKYDVRVSKKGQIKVDLNPELFDKEVELTIVAKSEKGHIPGKSAMEFVEQWSGFLRNQGVDDVDALKYSYLKEKYKWSGFCLILISFWTLP